MGKHSELKNGCKVTTAGIELHFKDCTECPFPKCREEVPSQIFREWLDLYTHGRINHGKIIKNDNPSQDKVINSF